MQKCPMCKSTNFVVAIHVEVCNDCGYSFACDDRAQYNQNWDYPNWNEDD